MNSLELVLKFGKRLLEFFLDFFVGFLNTVSLHLPGVPWKFGLVIDNLTADDVVIPSLFYGIFGTWLWLSLFSFWFLCDFSNVFRSLG